MRYKAGVLGVVVIMIAISATLLGSWVMSMDVVEEKVVKYNELADIVGEFDSQQTPTFTEYNPSTNYTGYFTDDTIVGDMRYFGGVDYTASNPNNYRLNLMPEDGSSGTITVTASQSTGRIDKIYLWTKEHGSDEQYNSSSGSCTIAELIQSQGWTNNKITLVCPDPIYTGAARDIGVVSFVSNKDIGSVRSGCVLMHEPGMTGDLRFVERDPPYTHYDKYNASDIMTPVLAMTCDMTTYTVVLYADKEMTQPISQGSPTDTYLVWSGHFYVYDADLQYSLSTIPPATYMDPSAGVVML